MVGLVILLWENLNAISVKNGVPKVDFKGFMEKAHPYWNVVRKVYNVGDPTFLLKGTREDRPANLDKITQEPYMAFI